ncbi:MAG: Gfo/Idh/MocA family oxidoreductase [Acidobacteria bacterium]|nr:Gfo/Idh/MocA family oxidoreductase [Acidobacteriota bacterium]
MYPGTIIEISQQWKDKDMAKIRFGILGCGYIGRTHAEAIAHLDSAELVAVWGGTRAPLLAKQFGVACEAAAEDLIRRPDVDAVIVSTPHHLHAGEALIAIEQGKHVLVEKPITTSVEDADRLIEAADRMGVVLSVVHQQRFRNNNKCARELIQSGAIGRVLTVNVSLPFYLGSLQQGGFGGSWAWWANSESIGHVINSAPHAIDLMRWILCANVVTVSAFCRTFLPGRSVEDTTFALLEFSNGTLMSLFSSNALPAPEFSDDNFRFRIIGTKGLIDLDPYGELKIEDEDGWRLVATQSHVGHKDTDTAFAPARMQAYWDQIQSFLDAIDGKPLTGASGIDGRAEIATCLAMLTSSRERRWVDL